jgi:hypothetical protein
MRSDAIGPIASSQYGSAIRSLSESLADVNALRSQNWIRGYLPSAPAIVAEPKSNSLSSYLVFSVPAAAGEDGARGAVRAKIVDAVDRQQIGKPRARA